MPRYEITFTRRVKQFHTAVIEAESESAARQSYIDGVDTVYDEDITDETGEDVQQVADDAPLTDDLRKPKIVWFATVDHEHGTNDYAGATQAEVEAQVVEFCREYADHEGAVLEGDTDRELIASYFAQVEHEFYDLRHLEVTF